MNQSTLSNDLGAAMPVAVAMAMTASISVGAIGTDANAASVLINEWNAVSGDESIKDGDTFFGTVLGNGGNWIELIVVEDHTSISGWSLDWEEAEEVSPGVNAAGTITFNANPIWDDLRAGTIITLIESSTGGGFDTATDTSFDPAGDDWWINVATTQEQGLGASGLVSTTTNDGVAGEFSIGKDDTTLILRDDVGAVVLGPLGEGESDWAGGGISGSEAGSLEGPEIGATLADWLAVDTASDLYDDTGSSSFGAYNVDFDEDTSTFVLQQDASALQALVIPEPATGLVGLGATLALLARRRR